ncbi:pyridoxal phosphate enzyme (YggS family) [Micrococcus cohnii]|uniref:Pyridoxal phosphate homeostasis protein n=1 Tax=Micrococcus cohnii TaxID=993416 RepID=A0A7W7GNM0_9MICC|nr:YggS family pyridoxal phosphate-dependent enzyme [Micrococcus cohnii]MBB4735429.1 pyridoxal phosphate enzyme (YggS family) [Micrococcus cohnii]
MTEARQQSRREQIAAALAEVRARIAAACQDAGRTQAPELIVVTKTHPATDVLALVESGVRNVGENRDQEARPKAAAVAQAAGASAPRWHFVGQLQTNKSKYVVRYASAVHSVDRVDLVEALGRAMDVAAERAHAAGESEREPLDCLVQVDLDPRPPQERPVGIGARGGAAPDAIAEIAATIAARPRLRLRGLMCVAPRGIDPAEAFAGLARHGARLRESHPEADWLSMGMSADLEQAVAAGATHLRVGSDILGGTTRVG